MGKKILLRDQESCVTNGGTTTKYSSLGRDASQGDLISAFFVCFSCRDLIYSYKIEAWDWKNDNIWLQLMMQLMMQPLS